MRISVGLLDFREEKRFDEMLFASAFRVGALYPETTFDEKTNIPFLKGVIFDMAMEGDTLKEKALYMEKFRRADARIKAAMQNDDSIDYSESISAAIDGIKKDLADRKTVLKQKFFSPNNVGKVLKCANVGSAFSVERAGAAGQKTEALNRHLQTMNPIKVMPFVTMEKSADLLKKIKSAYNELLNKYVSTGQQTDAMIDIMQGKKVSGNEKAIAEQASNQFAQGNNPEYFNNILKKHKDMEMSPELPTKTNKPKLSL